MGLRTSLQQAAREFAVQAPLRVGRTSATFALVSGIGALLGETPLTVSMAKCLDIGKSSGLFRFFSPSTTQTEQVKSTAQEGSPAKP